MTDPVDRPAVPDRAPGATGTTLAPRSEEEKQVWDVLEQARQNVKALVKREIEAELVTEQILNFRLR